MPRRQAVEEEEDFQFMEPPPRANGGTSWLAVLTPLTADRGRGKWARIKVFDTQEQAANAQNNLSRRNVRIPDPEGTWEFAARGVELFAKYARPSTKVARRRIGKK